MRLPSLFGSMRARLALFILLAMAALVGVLTYQEIRQHSDHAKDADANLLRVTRFAAHTERERIDAAKHLLVLASQAQSLRQMAATPDSQEAADACGRAVSVLDQVLPETTGFNLWDTSGDLLCSGKGLPRGAYNVRDRVWFQTAASRNAIATGAYELAPPDDAPSLGLGLPITDASGQTVVAYLSTGLKLDRPDDLLSTANLPKTGQIGLVDQNGVVISSSNGQSGQQSPAKFQDRNATLTNYLDGLVANGNPGRRAAVVRVTDAGDAAVTVVIAVDNDALVTPLTEALVRDLWPVVAVTIIALIVLWISAQSWILRPVRSLVAATDALAAGDLSTRVQVPHGIAEFERLATAFNAMAAARERATQAKDDFLGMVSHELKTPITVVLGNAAVLRRRHKYLEEDQRREALADIELAAERLSVIIDNMLVLARLDRGTELESEPLALSRLAERIAAEFAQRNGIEVNVVASDELMALGADTYVEQVLENLISNAAKYSPEGAAVDVRVQRDDDVAVVRVMDRGAGIEEVERQHIFEPFYRSDRTSRSADGVGIGLSVCGRLVEAMGGTIWSANREGGGSEFGFTLPLVSEAELSTPDEPVPAVPV